MDYAPRIAVLMCTLNGAQFLPAQLASLEQQTHANWRLIVSDDGSTDATLKISSTLLSAFHRMSRCGRAPARDPAPTLCP